MDEKKVAEIFETLKLWGVRTLREFAVLPVAGVSERLGQEGLKLQQLASGTVERHLKLKQPAPVFANSIELDHPLAELEALSFILARIANTVALSGRLEFTLKDLGYEFPKYPVPRGETMTSFLRRRTDEGARRRYTGQGGMPTYERARVQLDRELRLIEKLKLEGYFLIVWDIVQFCGNEGILIQGRGSAANSAVCYSLGITAVDPVGMELLFERFLSEERERVNQHHIDRTTRIASGSAPDRASPLATNCTAISKDSAFIALSSYS